nr:MAG TPA: hypothetical protein [Caudoviricetes sp.]
MNDNNSLITYLLVASNKLLQVSDRINVFRRMPENSLLGVICKATALSEDICCRVNRLFVRNHL